MKSLRSIKIDTKKSDLLQADDPSVNFSLSAHLQTPTQDSEYHEVVVLVDRETLL